MSRDFLKDVRVVDGRYELLGIPVDRDLVRDRREGHVIIDIESPNLVGEVEVDHAGDVLGHEIKVDRDRTGSASASVMAWRSVSGFGTSGVGATGVSEVDVTTIGGGES